MPNADALLAHPDIADWLRSNRGAEDRVRKAAAILAKNPDALEALKKLLPALSEKIIHVFFSYKHTNERSATEVVKLLRTYSADKLKISYGADFTAEIAGQDWRRKIKDEVCRANWFILLLPEQSDERDWCLYETGMFDRLTTSGDRLICLHHPDSNIPDPIEGFQNVPASVEAVKEFLRMVYIEDNPIPGLPAINPVVQDQIPNLAKQIVDAIRPPPKELFLQVYQPWVTLMVEGADQLKHKDDIDNAVLDSSNREALDLFGFTDQPKTWGQLRRYMDEAQGDSRWREELFHVIRKIGQGRKFFPIQAVFQASDGRLYKPVLPAVDRDGKGGPIIRFHIIFAEDVAAIDSSEIPLELSRLATVLRFAFRFRWEVLEKFGAHAMTGDDVERLDNALRRISKDWESRGIGAQDQISDLFPKEKRQRLEEMSVVWRKARNRDGTGDLDAAIRNQDPNACSDILHGFIAMNQEFLEMVIERFGDLIHEHGVASGGRKQGA
jgi:hypothetical protein